ncbi:hypothetical protein QBC35DRAFT_450125 [Podospora australis]|uniref:Uncharacterized protein n=1 Tax=Podospora australis TaxID=1536484 RepID=A0AAN7AK62_9PEZI|nr:hypothetical protein QBC35DRAFT_450125 [Podospora australis]
MASFFFSFSPTLHFLLLLASLVLGWDGGHPVDLVKQLSPMSCYWPDGTVAEKLAGCWDDVDHRYAGFCCEPGDGCSANGLCVGQAATKADRYYRGGCDDREWSPESSCPKVCLDISSDVGVGRCAGGATKWYCESRPPSRDKSCSGSFELSGNTTIFAKAGWVDAEKEPSAVSSAKPATLSPSGKATQVSVSESVVATTRDVVSPSTIASTTTSPPDPPAPASPELTPTETPPEDTTTTLPTDSASPTISPLETSLAGNETVLPPNTAQSGTEGGSNAIPIGVGVGIGGIVLLALVTLAAVYVQKRCRKVPVRAESPPPLDPAHKETIELLPIANPAPALKRSFTGFSGDDDAPFRQPTLPRFPDTAETMYYLDRAQRKPGDKTPYIPLP